MMQRWDEHFADLRHHVLCHLPAAGKVHPLDALTAQEISSIAVACKGLAEQEGFGELRFNVITLKASPNPAVPMILHQRSFQKHDLLLQILHQAVVPGKSHLSTPACWVVTVCGNACGCLQEPKKVDLLTFEAGGARPQRQGFAILQTPPSYDVYEVTLNLTGPDHASVEGWQKVGGNQHTTEPPDGCCSVVIGLSSMARHVVRITTHVLT